MDIKAGEIWKIVHSRKGALTIRFSEDGSTADPDSWLSGEIVEGRVRYMSDENRLAQIEEGRGTRGDELTMRASFVRLIERVGAA